MLKRILQGLFIGSTVVLTGFTMFVIDAGRDRTEQFAARQGERVKAEIQKNLVSGSELLHLSSNTGLSVRIRVVRPDVASVKPLHTLLILGGHRTGSRAVDLVGTPQCCAVVAIDYPLQGELPSDTLGSILTSSGLVRRAALDTVPAIFLVVTWLEQQNWVDKAQIDLVGVSLGVPFATTAAALDRRIDKLWLIHGAADNRDWIRHNVLLRDTSPLMQPVYTNLIYWLLYADNFDTGARVGSIAPRPVVIIGARADERTPAGQTEALFAQAREPKELMWTDGAHIDPDRIEVIQNLLRILLPD